MNKEEHVRRITFDVASDALALVALAAYFQFVPRRFRAGFRVWIVVAIALAVLAAAALFVIASGMPHGTERGGTLGRRSCCWLASPRRETSLRTWRSSRSTRTGACSR